MYTMRTFLIAGAILSVTSTAPVLAIKEPGTTLKRVSHHARRTHNPHLLQSSALSKREKPRRKPSRRKRCNLTAHNKAAAHDAGNGAGQDRPPCTAGGVTIPFGASGKSERGTGPNGSLAWLSCGIEAGGWNPPMVRMEDLKYATELGPVYDLCKPHLPLFQKYSDIYHIPVIVLAGIAMQESTCNKDAYGKAGEQGLFQITRDKCEGRDDYACREPDFNVGKGAEYLAAELQRNNGNFIAALGHYNGWQVGKTTVATAKELGRLYGCGSQNNLDYLHEFVNGWLQNVDPHTQKMGVYNNLAAC